MSAYSTFRSQRKRKLKAEINVVPFIDVMLVLLIIFMITVPVIHHSVKVDLPEDMQQEKVKSKGNKANDIVIQVMAKQKFDDQQRYSVQSGQADPQFFAQDDAGFQALSAYVALLRAGKDEDERPIIVFGDKAAEYGDVVGLFLRLKNEHIKSVKLATQPAKKQGK